MKKTFLILIVALGAAVMQGQEKWDLQKCIDYALQHSITLKQSELRSQSSEVEWKQVKQSRLPSLAASLSDGYSIGRSQSRDGVYVDQNSNSANASLSADINIFQGMRTQNNISSSRFGFMAAMEDLQKAKNDLSLNVASFYLTVLLQKEALKLSEEQLLLTEDLEKKTKDLVDNGREPLSKLYEIQAQKANDKFNVMTASKNHQLALLDLVQLLELEMGLAFDVVVPVLEDPKTLPIPQVSVENAFQILPDVKAEELRLQSAEKNLLATKSAYYPSLSFGASTSTGLYYLNNPAVPNEAFGNQLSNNWKSYFGLSLSVPIFNRMTTRHNVTLSRIQIDQQSTEIEQAKKAIFKDIQRSTLNAQVAKERYGAAEESVKANQEAFRYVEERYTSGRATVFDLQQAKYNLEKSLSDRLQAKYELIFNVKILDFYKGVPITL